MQAHDTVADRWRRFYATIARTTPAQANAAIDAIWPMLGDEAGKHLLSQALGLDLRGPGDSEKDGSAQR